MSLVLENVSKTVGAATHLDDVSLGLEPGQVQVLLGPTLAGKTTLMRVMAGLERPTAGRVIGDGSEITGLPAGRRSVAMVYEPFMNCSNLTVFENIASPLLVRRVPRAEIVERVREVGCMLRIEPYLDRLPDELSGGRQPRVPIARALVERARLLLLDEPFVTLDDKLREELRVERGDCSPGRRRRSSTPRPSRSRRLPWEATWWCRARAACCRPARPAPATTVPDRRGSPGSSRSHP